MRSLSEIETTVKRASRAIGFSWGVAEEVGKCVRLLELFGLPGIKNVNQYYIDKKVKKFENLKLITENNFKIHQNSSTTRHHARADFLFKLTLKLRKRPWGPQSVPGALGDIKNCLWGPKLYKT